MSTLETTFEEHRPELARLAYRMLGTLSDADDVLQEAYLRWSRVDPAEVQSPRAYLHSIVTRLCIDQRRQVEARKEKYTGPWLPEPIVEKQMDASGRLETAESISLAFLVVLERLSPVERAAYLLRRIFDFDYAEIATILDKEEASCRQLVSRAEARVHEGRPRFAADAAVAERITGAFMSAVQTGDVNGLVGLLAADAVLVSDGGGKVAAALAPVRGADRIARFFVGILKKSLSGVELRRVEVNGQPGLAALIGTALDSVLTFDFAEGRIIACYIVRNPDKLARVRVA